MIACLGAAALLLAAEARAEGGEGSSVVPPSEVHAQGHNAEVVADAEDKASEDKPVEAVESKASAKQGDVASAKPKNRLATDIDHTSNTNAARKAEPEVADVEDSVPSAKNARARLDAQRAAAARPLIQRYASEHNVPFALADAIVRLESRYNPAARNGVNVGLTQINTGTARSLGYSGPASGLQDAETNLRYGLKYLAMAYRLANGDTCGTLLRYQFGHRALTMNKASQRYCDKVKTILAASR
ncbi:transglycosylase SLT domain-containing protein [Microvirga sp. 2MCAF38]|uniref:transglycosylase SLT domain-containing protein n=1 Tax=Microvirga sp. 2MCAF38 TaxID=3232989 RepID=UPI003F9BCCE8